MNKILASLASKTLNQLLALSYTLQTVDASAALRNAVALAIIECHEEANAVALEKAATFFN